MARHDDIDTVDPRESRLPIWAQNKLDTARRRVRDAERQAEEYRLATSPEESNTLLRTGSWDKIVGLGESPRIVFEVNAPEGRERIDTYDYIEAHVTEAGDGISVRGGTITVIECLSSNHFTIYLRNGNLRPFHRG